MKRHFANMVFALILAAYTVYAALDTFVIVRVLTPDTLTTTTARAVPPAHPPPPETRRSLHRADGSSDRRADCDGIPRGTGDPRAPFHRHGIPR